MADLSVVVADNHPIILDGLYRILSETPGLVVLAACTNCAQTLKAVAAHHPDILLLDVQFPDRDGVSAIPEFLTSSPETRVVIFTATLDAVETAEALRVGAKAIVQKTITTDRLIDTVRAVAAENWISPEPAFPPRFSQSGTHDFSALSPRERDVAQRVSGGATNREIASQLLLTVGTVKLHLHRVFRKLGVRNRVELSLITASQPTVGKRRRRMTLPRRNTGRTANRARG